mgnify:CR=1 FL=1|tara:strand:+ start:26 stop:214 length:189 start_codon:yes stop_codon:yes gene_type:complete
MNIEDERSIANMLALWSVDFQKTETDAIAYLDRVLAFTDETQRERIVWLIKEGINKMRGSRE